MDIQKIYINERGEAAIKCPQCGRKRVVDASQYKEPNQKIKARCPCGWVFAVILEWRRAYRKTVAIHGQYFKDGADPQSGEMLMIDISFGGVGFRPMTAHNIQVNDLLHVKFVLNDAHNSLISRKIKVKSVNDWFVGGEFCDNKFDKALAFYLMP
jgi:hypothetical protein